MTLINPNISDVFILFILSMIALFKLSIVLVVSVVMGYLIHIF